MKRRKFIRPVGGTVIAWPHAARAQQPAMPLVGFLRSGTLDDGHRVTAFRQGPKEAGFIEGQNVAIEYRSDEYQTDRLPLLLADLLRRQVALIVGFNTPAGARGQSRNHDSAGCLCDRGRPSGQPARWQRHRCQLHHGGTCGKTAWALA